MSSERLSERGDGDGEAIKQLVEAHRWARQRGGLPLDGPVDLLPAEAVEVEQEHVRVKRLDREGLARLRLLKAMNDGFDRLRSDQASWAQFKAEAALWDATSADAGRDRPTAG